MAETIERTHTRRIAQAASKESFVGERAQDVRKAAARAARKGTTGGPREQLKGHFIEALDISAYNARGRLPGKRLVPPRAEMWPSQATGRLWEAPVVVLARR